MCRIFSSTCDKGKTSLLKSSIVHELSELLGICLASETNFPGREIPLSCLIVFDNRREYPSFLRKEFPFFGENLLKQERILSTSEEGYSTTGKAGRKGISEVFFDGKKDSTNSTRTVSDVTQLGIV